MIKSGLYSVLIQNENSDVLAAGNITVVNTVDDDFDIVVGGDGDSLWNGYARTEFGMSSVEIDVSKTMVDFVFFDTLSIDIPRAEFDDLNDGYQIEVPGFGRRVGNDTAFSDDEPVVFSIRREFDIEMAE